MNILMLNQDQFGYKAGYYHYCKYLSSQGHHIVFLCNDQHLDKMALDNVEVIYVSQTGSIKWRLEFISTIKRIIRSSKIDVVMCSYYKGCSLNVSSFGKIPSIIDVRSGDLSPKTIIRNAFNRLIKLEVSRFSRIMVLSESLARKLKLKKSSYEIVPLGSDEIGEADKDFSNLSLLYVGTLFQREIHKTLEGLRLFLDEFPDVKIHYDIVGFGEGEQFLVDRISELSLSEYVTFHGRVNYENLKPFFDKANIGVAFVPKTPWYDCQPSTKIYEYLLSGMYCLATDTYENSLSINGVNGILHDDSAQAFCEALKSLYLKERFSISSKTIRETMSEHLWPNVINRHLLPLVCNLVSNC